MNDPNRAEAFRGVYEATYGHILAYALRRTERPEDAAEVVAETFLTAWRRFDDMPKDVKALPWLYGVERRVLANVRRGAARHHQLAERLRAVATRAEARDVEVGALDALRSAFDRLSPADKEYLGLVAWEGLDYSQVAAAMDCSRNAARIRVHRARRRFASELARVGINVKQGRRPGHEHEVEEQHHSGVEEAV